MICAGASLSEAKTEIKRKFDKLMISAYKFDKTFFEIFAIEKITQPELWKYIGTFRIVVV